jgi:predicted nucleotidyltransferase
MNRKKSNPKEVELAGLTSALRSSISGAQSSPREGIDEAESALFGIRNRRRLQQAHLLGFNPLYLAHELKEARNTTEEHESLQQLLPAALSLHRRLPEPYALKKLAVAQANSIAFRQRHKLRALAKVIGLEGDPLLSLEGEVPTELIRSVSTEIPAEMQPLFRRSGPHRHQHRKTQLYELRKASTESQSSLREGDAAAQSALAISVAKRVAEFLKQRGATKVILFGSLATDDYRYGISDIDIYFEGLPYGEELRGAGDAMSAFSDFNLDPIPAGHCPSALKKSVEEFGVLL